MANNAKNGEIAVGNSIMDYVAFGAGTEPLILLPGLSDGLRTVRGTARKQARTYREYAKDYRVYIFSRKRDLPEGYTTRDMARDQAEAMDALGIGAANVMGISQGGMIAQWLAIDRPDLVRKLVLAVSLCHPTGTLKRTMYRRIDWAREKDYHPIVIDTIESSCILSRRKLYRPFYPFLGRTGAPDDFTRFIIHAEACLSHDSTADLHRIACPTLVIGGDSDRNVGAGTSEDLAAHIHRSELYIYPSLGHAAFLEAEDFNERVLEFLAK